MFALFMKYEDYLDRLIFLLEKSGEDHWVCYFKEVLAICKSGNKNRSYKKALSAYGGMCGFNDLTLNCISDSEVKEIQAIRSYLWSYCRLNKKKMWGVF